MAIIQDDWDDIINTPEPTKPFTSLRQPPNEEESPRRYGALPAMPEDKVVSDGLTASYYELPPNAEELQDLISFRNMNAQLGEIFRASYRYGIASHSDQLRDIRKIKFYADAEEQRLLKYVLVAEQKND